jgi:hypothetical protein
MLVSSKSKVLDWKIVIHLVTKRSFGDSLIDPNDSNLMNLVILSRNIASLCVVYFLLLIYLLFSFLSHHNTVIPPADILVHRTLVRSSTYHWGRCEACFAWCTILGGRQEQTTTNCCPIIDETSRGTSPILDIALSIEAISFPGIEAVQTFDKTVSYFTVKKRVIHSGVKSELMH